MYQPIPALDYSYNMLPWDRRIRVCLDRIDLEKANDPAVRSLSASSIKNEVDSELDSIFWIPNKDSAWKRLRALIAKYSALSNEASGIDVEEAVRRTSQAKLFLLKKAKDDALCGISNKSSVPRWKAYMLEFVKVKDSCPGRVFFTSVDYNQAFNWVLEAVLSQEEEIMDEFKWNVYRLYHLPHNNPNKKIDITQAFWDYAYPLAENPLSLF